MSLKLSETGKIAAIVNNPNIVVGSDRVIVVPATTFNEWLENIPANVEIIICVVNGTSNFQQEKLQKKGRQINAIVRYKPTDESILGDIKLILEVYAQPPEGVKRTEHFEKWKNERKNSEIKSSTGKTVVSKPFIKYESVVTPVVEAPKADQAIPPNSSAEVSSVPITKPIYNKRDVARLLVDLINQHPTEAQLIDLYRTLGFEYPADNIRTYLYVRNFPYPKIWQTGVGYTDRPAPKELLEIIKKCANDSHLYKKSIGGRPRNIIHTISSQPVEVKSVHGQVPGPEQLLDQNLVSLKPEEIVAQNGHHVFSKPLNGESSADFLLRYAKYAKQIEEEYQSIQKISEGIQKYFASDS